MYNDRNDYVLKRLYVNYPVYSGEKRKYLEWCNHNFGMTILKFIVLI